ncbi:MAG: hypothetical protein IT463_11120 [Planctomycetes bacterium]|nr:hypothetical protein [Planctomycetota bacterium]
MNEEDLHNRFRGPTPPPEVDRRVLQAAGEHARGLGSASSRLSEEAKPTYSNESGPRDRQREQAMSDTIVFPCPACGTKYNVGPQHAGKKTTCKKCGATVTVPTPEVANPTIIGGTRTIRRADIDPGVSAAHAPVQGPAAMAAAPAPADAEVDMKGGASVMRKNETVFGQQPVQAGPARAPGRAGPAPVSRAPAPAGRPAGPGVPAPKGKSKTPLFLGIGGGVLGLIVIVAIIIGSGPDNAGGGQGGGGSTAGGGPAANAAPQKSADEILLAEIKSRYNNKDSLKTNEIEDYYKQCRERKAKPDFKQYMDQWADELAKRAEGEPGKRLATLALMLDDDGYPAGKAMLKKASVAMEDSATRPVQKRRPNGETYTAEEPDEIFVKVVQRLGWKPYKRPETMDAWGTFDLPEVKAYENAYMDIEEIYRKVNMMPPEKITALVSLEEAAVTAGKALDDAHAKDGFAKNARLAFGRFCEANAGGKVNRKKRQRSWSLEAMGRKGEQKRDGTAKTIRDIWTYTYWKPFMVYVELPVDQEQGELSAQFKETLESKSALLQQEHEWFKENFIDAFSLKRQKPQFNAEVAEREGWPMEIMVLKDKATFDQYFEDVNGQPNPGARAFYSPLDEKVITYDDTGEVPPDMLWFNESVLIHETFHLLSDHYAANPMFELEEMMEKTRYANVLVQEGITDSMSGFRRTGEGRNAKYEFLKQNHLRLKSWQSIYEQVGKKNIYRIQDMIQCTHYGQCQQVGVQRLASLGIARPRSQEHAMQLGGFCLGLYYAAGCQASYFFNEYKEGGKYVYRDKWWTYLRKDYTGEITHEGVNPEPGIKAFKEVFGIKTDKDWDAMEKAFVEFTLALKPEDVGRGADEGRLEDGGDEGGGDEGGDSLPDYHEGCYSDPALAGPTRRELAGAAR